MPQDDAKEYAGDVTPEDAWKILEEEDSAVLVDCRTDAEWSYVGKTDLSSIGKDQLDIAWKIFPAMEVNPTFTDQIAAACPDKDAKLLIMCRSGVRSIAAAIAATEAGYTNAYNILEGFEGDKDADGHRGNVGGWKHRGLPWKQG